MSCKYFLIVNEELIIESYHPFENILDFIKMESKMYKKHPNESSADVLEKRELQEDFDIFYEIQVYHYNEFLNAALKDIQEIQEELVDSKVLETVKNKFIDCLDKDAGESLAKEYVRNSPILKFKKLCDIVQGLYVYSNRYKSVIEDPKKSLFVTCSKNFDD